MKSMPIYSTYRQGVCKGAKPEAEKASPTISFTMSRGIELRKRQNEPHRPSFS